MSKIEITSLGNEFIWEFPKRRTATPYDEAAQEEYFIDVRKCTLLGEKEDFERMYGRKDYNRVIGAYGRIVIRKYKWVRLYESGNLKLQIELEPDEGINIYKPYKTHFAVFCNDWICEVCEGKRKPVKTSEQFETLEEAEQFALQISKEYGVVTIVGHLYELEDMW